MPNFVLNCAQLCMKCSLSVVFLYFFAFDQLRSLLAILWNSGITLSSYYLRIILNLLIKNKFILKLLLCL